MCSITTVSCSVLINGYASPFFRYERVLRQGFPLSPMLFILVAQGLSRALAVENQIGSSPIIKITSSLQVTHLLFVDDILIFTAGPRSEARTLKNIINLFSKATRILINKEKSILTTFLLLDGEKGLFRQLFPFS
jgi:hypothetical protein